VGRKAALTAAGVPVPFVLADLWALGHLRSQCDAPPQPV
jgi:hypothetical protein